MILLKLKTKPVYVFHHVVMLFFDYKFALMGASYLHVGGGRGGWGGGV